MEEKVKRLLLKIYYLLAGFMMPQDLVGIVGRRYVRASARAGKIYKLTLRSDRRTCRLAPLRNRCVYLR